MTGLALSIVKSWMVMTTHIHTLMTSPPPPPLTLLTHSLNAPSANRIHESPPFRRRHQSERPRNFSF